MLIRVIPMNQPRIEACCAQVINPTQKACTLIKARKLGKSKKLKRSASTSRVMGG